MILKQVTELNSTIMARIYNGFADFGALRPLRALGVIASKLWCCGVVEVDLRAVTDLFDLGLHNYHPFDGQNN